MARGHIQEIVVEASEADREHVEGVAREWLRRLALPDGARIAVVTPVAPTRPRRFVALDGQIVSPQQYAAVSAMVAVEQVLRQERRPLDTWALLQIGRRTGVLPAASTLATLTRALRLLARQGRVQEGAEPGIWQVKGAKVAAA